MKLLNGYRGATHSQVVQMLRTSGPRPTLVVTSDHDSHARLEYGSLLRSSNPEDLVTETRRSVGAFKDKVKKISEYYLAYRYKCSYWL